MRVNCTVYTRNYLKHNELLLGGTIDFKMTERPNMLRGTHESDLPYSFSEDEEVH
jgi:Putative alpha-1,2-mannosidase